MKRGELLKRIAKAAGDKGIEWTFVRAGGRHDVYRLGDSVQLSIPRHRDINELTARAILKTAEEELGKDGRQ